jgi:hypothetical protein
MSSFTCSLLWVKIYMMLTVSTVCRGGVKGWTVFYHFVGAVPGSTELLTLLRRMLHAIGTFTVSGCALAVSECSC